MSLTLRPLISSRDLEMGQLNPFLCLLSYLGEHYYMKYKWTMVFKILGKHQNFMDSQNREAGTFTMQVVPLWLT